MIRILTEKSLAETFISYAFGFFFNYLKPMKKKTITKIKKLFFTSSTIITNLVKLFPTTNK